MQSRSGEAERRIEKARTRQALSLNLGDLALRELPVSLGDLPQLKILYLGGLGPTETGGLEPQLSRVNHALSDLTPLAGLQQLQVLNLQRTGAADLAPLAQLQQLRSLDLGFTDVMDLAPLIELQALQSLDLTSCHKVTDLAPLAGLQELRQLTLSFTGVRDFDPLAQLQQLQYLDLSHTGVTDLAPLVGLQALQTLILQYCVELRDLALLPKLQALRDLDVYGCQLAIPATILRAFADHPHLSGLVADAAEGVPEEVLSDSFLRDNCLPRLRTYLSELDLGAEAENEVKVILLGNGSVGKTQLCRRFRGEPFDEAVQSTHGVQVWRQELRIRTGTQEQTFQVNWWDFGGQDIYHGTHALFLSSRAVFLILWTPNLENRDEYSEDGVILRNQPLAYWLDYVRTLGNRGPVIVVQSQCDRFADRRPFPPRLEDFCFFESSSYSAKEDLGRETLEGHLRDALLYLLELNGALEIGHGRAEVRRRLYEWRNEDQQRKPAERQHRTLTLNEFRALCREVGDIVSWEHALDYFHHTGAVFHRPDLFSDCIVLDQDWALNAVYSVFHRGRAVPLLRDSGRFTREDLALLVWQEHSLEEQSLFLDLMESCGVCFRCGETARGESLYAAPDLLPRFDVIARRLHAWKEHPGTPTLRLEYRFFHQAVIRGLMSEIGRQAGDLAEYWKYGLWLKDGRRDAQVLLQFEDTSTADAPGAGALELKAQGREPLGLLREVRAAILSQPVGEEPEEWLRLDGVMVARNALATVIGGSVVDVHNRPVPVAAFAAFFEDRQDRLGEGRATGDAAGIEINPRRLTASEKPGEIFISYAWGDDTPAGRIRAQAVESLYSALAEDGLSPVWDLDQIRSGERISAFVRRLTRADLVVAVISKKYLRSFYCMYEIYKLWQRFQGDADDLVRCLVPIVLPDVRLENFEKRAPYLEYWSKRAAKLETLIRNPNLSPSRESWDEVRLVRQFAFHVDDILVFLENVLMPRRLEAHLDNHFQAIKEALRQRLSAPTNLARDAVT